MLEAKKRKTRCAMFAHLVPLAPDRLHTSNYILLKIPVEIHNLGHGERLTCMDSERLPDNLGLSDQDIESLSQRGPIRTKICYVELNAQYEQLLLDGTCATTADFVRHTPAVFFSFPRGSPIRRNRF